MCGQNSMQALAPNANIQQSQITGSKIPAGHAFDRFGAAMTKHAREKADPKTRAIFEGVGVTPGTGFGAPPKQATSGGSTGLSIRTGSGTRVAARKKATARQTRTKRFTTR